MAQYSPQKNNIYGSFDGLYDNRVRSVARTFHDTLTSQEVNREFNVYKNWASFNLAVDVDALSEDSFKKTGTGRQANRRPGSNVSLKDKNGENISPVEFKVYNEISPVKSTGVRSLFNKLHAVPLESEQYEWRVSQNMPLLDSPKTRQLQRSMNACTVSDLVQKSKLGLMGTCVYDWSDFMFCKYLGRVSNNHMITLRRFTIPVTDYVKPYGSPKAINPSSYGALNTTKTDNLIETIPKHMITNKYIIITLLRNELLVYRKVFFINSPTIN